MMRAYLKSVFKNNFMIDIQTKIAQGFSPAKIRGESLVLLYGIYCMEIIRIKNNL